MSHSIDGNRNSESSTAVGEAQATHHQHQHQFQQLPHSRNTIKASQDNSNGGVSSSGLVAASGSLVLENEQILRLFPKCRPRGPIETMNQFYSNNREQQPQTQSVRNSSAINSGHPDVCKTYAPNMKINYNGNLSSPSSQASSAAAADHKFPQPKKERVTTTNPFLTSHSDGLADESHGHMMNGARKLSHSQSDYGVCSIGSNVSPFPHSASSSQLAYAPSSATEMMSRNFQRHLKNPFIGAGALKLNEYEEEQFNIIVQDQQTTVPQQQPEYYFDRRTVRTGSQPHYLTVGHSPVNTVPEEDHPQLVAEQTNDCLGNHTSPRAMNKAQESGAGAIQSSNKKRNKSVAVVSDGEVVIFDSWYNAKGQAESVSEGNVYRQNYIADPDPISPESVPSRVADEDNGSSVAGMVIGKLMRRGKVYNKNSRFIRSFN